MNKQYGMVIDSSACIGCNACAVACKIENNLPDEVWWNRVVTNGGSSVDTPSGSYPQLSMSFYPIACQHCENPACVKVCPVGATYKDQESGAVRQDCDKCIGCRMCMSACPYTGVRSFNWQEPRYTVGHPVGSADAPNHQLHTVEKCTLCWHRIAKGEEPACVEVCPARARTFGDLSDGRSSASQLIASHEYKQLLPDEGTRPSVYYLV